MRSLRRLSFAALVAGLGFLVVQTADQSAGAADPPQKLKQKLKQEAKKKAEEEARKAEEAKKAEEARATDEARKKAAEEEKRTAAAKKAASASKLDAIAIAALIDKHIDAKLAAEKITPSAECTDAEFLRRAYLDVTGVIPTADQAKAFLDDKSSGKRAKLIDTLLDDPNYGRKHADIWLGKLFPKDSDNRFVQPGPFHEWLKGEFNKNTPWDQFVSTLVSATGTVDEHPEVTFFLANRSIDKLTDATTQHFLGVRLGCAQCHNHPFAPTKQAEYWGMAAFFSKVAADRPKNANKGGDNTQLGVKEGAGPTRAKDFVPESAKKVSAKFLGGPEPKLDAKAPYRPELAKWMTAPTNPYFARAAVNRTWAMLFGNGIVDPVDDLIDRNKPSHPELLDDLAKQFVASGYDQKHLIRAICLSRAYQRSAKPTGSNKGDDQLFSHMAVKQMTAYELFDSLTAVLGGDKGGKPDARKGADNPKRGPATERDRFAAFYTAGAEEVNPTEFEAGIPQMLRIMNSKNGPITATARQLAGKLPPTEAIEKLYLTALARRPTADETKQLTAHLAKNPADGYADVLWAVVNSSEFSMIR
jgi:hypothetical protein